MADDKAIGSNIWFMSIYLSVPAILTFFFWFVTAKVAGAESLGIASTLASLGTIISTVVVVDMSTGMKQYLGKCIFSDDIGKFKQILSSTIIISSVLTIACSIFILIPELNILSILGIEQKYALLLITMIFAQSFLLIFSEALISSLRARKLVLPQILGNLLRFPLLIILVSFFNVLDIGTIIAYSSALVVPAIIFGVYLLKMVSGNKEPFIKDFIINTMTTIRASLSSWLPNMLYILGIQLGVLTVFSSSGAIEASRIYLSLGIFWVTTFIIRSINLVSHPFVGTISDPNERTKYLLSCIRISLAASMPIASFVIFYGRDMLLFIGPEYASASSALSALMLSIPFVAISETLYYFFYGMGKHNYVLNLGLAGNVPRMILYILLSGPLGSVGAGLAYFIGSLSQFACAFGISKREAISLEWKIYLLIGIVSLLPVWIFWLVGIGSVISAILLVILCLFFYVRIKILSESMFRNMIYSVFNKKGDRISNLGIKIIRKIQQD